MKRIDCVLLLLVTTAAIGLEGQTTTIYSFNVPATGGYATNSNLNQYSDSVMGSWTFGYDSLHRLTSGTVTGSTQPLNPNFCWAYDNFGNRLNQSSSTQPFQSGTTCQPATGASVTINAATYNAQNQIVSTNASGSSFAPVYDADGNMTSDGTNNYLYDAEGRICAVGTAPISGGIVMTQYLYNADGQRVAKGNITTWSCDPSTNGFVPTKQYFLGTSGEQLTELDGQGNWQHTNVYAAGEQIGTYDAQGLHFQVYDWLGTRRAQANYAGALEATYSSLPFGDDLIPSGSPDSGEQHFTGKERDTESGLDYFGARYYASSMGRFSNPDPGWFFATHLENPQSWNLYSYVLDNPVNAIDPDGYDCIYLNDSGTGVDDKRGTGAGTNPDNSGNPSGIDRNSNQGECNQNHGYWVDGTVRQVTLYSNSNDVGLSGQNDDGTLTASSYGQHQNADQTVATDSTAAFIGAQNNAEFPQFSRTFDPYPTRLFGTHWCGPGGGGVPINALDAGCKAHDQCFEAARISAANNAGGGSMTLQQAATAQACNAALAGIAAKNPGIPGSTRVSEWLKHGDQLMVITGGRVDGYLAPGTAVR